MSRGAAAIALGLLLGAAGSGSASERIWLGIEQPADRSVERGPSALLEVVGWAGTLRHATIDLAVVIDISWSTRHASGADVNGDGHVGAYGWQNRRDWWSFFRGPRQLSDPADSVMRAELEAVRRLIDSLDSQRSRVGVVTFWDDAQIRSSIGNTSLERDAALDFIANTVPRGRTNIGRAIEVAVELLEAGRAESPEHERVVILLSDDQPTVPAPAEAAAEKAVAAARAARRAGIPVHTFALAPQRDDSAALLEIARVTGASYTALSEPGDIIAALPRIDLTGLADVTIQNVTTGQRGRATRVSADGSWNGFVELSAGENLLRVTARGAANSVAVRDRRVFYEPREARSAEERQEVLDRLEDLKNRIHAQRVETELLREIEQRRGQQKMRRDLEINLD